MERIFQAHAGEGRAHSLPARHWRRPQPFWWWVDDTAVQASKNARFRHQPALQDLPMREQTRAKAEGAGATLIWSGNQTTSDSSCKQGHDGYLASHDRAMLCQTQQYSQWSRCSSLHTAMLVLFCRARGPGLQERATKDTRISHLTAPVTLLLLLYFSIPFFLTQKCSHNQEEDLAPSICSDWDCSSGFKPEFDEVGAPPLNYSPLQRENMVITGSEATCWHIAAWGTCVHPASWHHIPPMCLHGSSCYFAVCAWCNWKTLTDFTRLRSGIKWKMHNGEWLTTGCRIYRVILWGNVQLLPAAYLNAHLRYLN